MQTLVGTDINFAKKLLDGGELVAIPTETVYGLAANALNEKAVVKIYEVKNRPSFNPLILHVPDISKISEYAFVEHLPEFVLQYMPGPLTLLLPKKETVPEIITAGNNKVAVRIPNHPISLALLQKLSFPLAAPSANPSGYVSPTTANHVLNGLNGKIPYILDGGPCNIGLESTIIELEGNKIIVHRKGGLAIETIQKEKGYEVIFPQNKNSPVTSGQLKSHYATHVPLVVGDIEEVISKNKTRKIAVISFMPLNISLENVLNFPLSKSQSLQEAAANLFSVMRAIDLMQIDLIVAEKFPDYGLGRAINDRLNRAQQIFKIS